MDRQVNSPGKEKQTNWLPTPKAKFIGLLRFYWASKTPPSIIASSCKPLATKTAHSRLTAPGSLVR